VRPRRRATLYRQMIGFTCLGVGPAPGEHRDRGANFAGPSPLLIVRSSSRGSEKPWPRKPTGLRHRSLPLGDAELHVGKRDELGLVAAGLFRGLVSCGEHAAQVSA